MAAERKARLRAAMAYLCDRYPHPSELSNARLTKLVYLADWESARVFGRQLTSVEWKFNHYGPWVPDVLEVAQSDAHFQVVSEQNAYGSPKTRIAVHDAQPLVRELTAEDKAILDRVMDQTRNLYFGQFIDYVYATYPVKSQRRYAILDLPALAQEANRLEPPEPLRTTSDRTTVRLGDYERELLRDQVENALRTLLGSEVPGSAAEDLPFLEDPTIEEIDSSYDLDIRIGSEGNLVVGTQAKVAVEGIVNRSQIVNAEKQYGELKILDEWSTNYDWVSVTRPLWVTLLAIPRDAPNSGWNLVLEDASIISP